MQDGGLVASPWASRHRRRRSSTVSPSTTECDLYSVREALVQTQDPNAKTGTVFKAYELIT